MVVDDDIRKILSGEPSQPLDLLLRYIQRGVAKALAGYACTVSPRDDLLDCMQEVLAHLYAEDGKELRRWDRDKGSFSRYFYKVAYRRTIDLCRKRERRPLGSNTSALDESAPPRASAADPERNTAVSEELRQLLSHIQSRLDPRGQQILELLFLQGLEVAEVAERMSMTPDAVRSRRSRIRTIAREFAKPEDSEHE